MKKYTPIINLLVPIMKKSILFASLLLLAGCSNQFDNNEIDLFQEMVSYSEHFSVLKEQATSITKSGGFELDLFDSSSYDLDKIDPKFLEYYDLYFQPDCYNDWDEKAILTKVNADIRFTQEEKIQFAHTISGVYSYKKDASLIHTKARAEAGSCEEIFYIEFERISRSFIIAYYFAMIFEPYTIGELAACIYYYFSISDCYDY